MDFPELTTAQRYLLIVLVVSLVGVSAILLVVYFSLSEEPNKVLPLRNDVYSHLDKICKDVNFLDKIQIAVYFLVQSWLTKCDAFTKTSSFSSLKNGNLLKKRIHDAVTKKIHDFNKQEERTVEDCIIEYYKTEIGPTPDDFRTILFDLVLQGYVNTFRGELDETGELLKMETLNCNNSTSCQYSFKKPTATSKVSHIFKKKNADKREIEDEKCVKIFQYFYIWNGKIRKPEHFEWVYFLLFKGLQTSLNATEVDIKQHLKCSSEKMNAMKEVMTNVDEVDPFMVRFLQERDLEMDIINDELEYASESQTEDLNHRTDVQMLLADLVLNTYMKVFGIKPKDGKITLTSATGRIIEVELIPTDYIDKL